MFFRRSFRRRNSRNESSVPNQSSTEPQAENTEPDENTTPHPVTLQEELPPPSSPGVVIYGPNYSGPRVLTTEAELSVKSKRQTKQNNILYSLEARNEPDPIKKLVIQTRALDSALLDGTLDQFEYENAKQIALIEARKKQIKRKKNEAKRIYRTPTQRENLETEVDAEIRDLVLSSSSVRPVKVVVAQTLDDDVEFQTGNNETGEIMITIDSGRNLEAEQEEQRREEEADLENLAQEFGLSMTATTPSANMPGKQEQPQSESNEPNLQVQVVSEGSTASKVQSLPPSTKPLASHALQRSEPGNTENVETEEDTTKSSHKKLERMTSKPFFTSAKMQFTAEDGKEEVTKTQSNETEAEQVASLLSVFSGRQSMELAQRLEEEKEFEAQSKKTGKLENSTDEEMEDVPVKPALDVGTFTFVQDSQEQGLVDSQDEDAIMAALMTSTPAIPEESKERKAPAAKPPVTQKAKFEIEKKELPVANKGKYKFNKAIDSTAVVQVNQLEQNEASASKEEEEAKIFEKLLGNTGFVHDENEENNRTVGIALVDSSFSLSGPTAKPVFFDFSKDQSQHPSQAPVQKRDQGSSMYPNMGTTEQRVSELVKPEPQQIRYALVHALLEQMEQEQKSPVDMIASMEDLQQVKTITEPELEFAKQVVARHRV
eukprot:snap_masked-scaffold_7-processed-gene-13.43-mRNA-1 protein AED:1.00 eAED:1.00 QI:0/-1/0/0/-1/1/1/0/658